MACEGSHPWYCLKWQNPEHKDLGYWDRTKRDWSKNCPYCIPPLGSTLGPTALEALLDARVVLGTPGLTQPTTYKNPLKPFPTTTHYTSLPGFHTWVHTQSNHLGVQAIPKNLVLGTPIRHSLPPVNPFKSVQQFQTSPGPYTILTDHPPPFSWFHPLCPPLLHKLVYNLRSRILMYWRAGWA